MTATFLTKPNIIVMYEYSDLLQTAAVMCNCGLEMDGPRITFFHETYVCIYIYMIIILVENELVVKVEKIM